ncbi:hypothetical protein F4167_00380 [Candidatus Poribacteria bacterium]|nr:hypothetical protein [Candidatus Poribacteria bacterium]
MAIRSSLGIMSEHVQNNPSRAELKATLNNLPNPMEHWEAFETAYIDKKIAENQRLNDAMRNNPDVIGGIFTGTNNENFLPLTTKRVYVRRGETGASFMGEELSVSEKFNLLFKGIEPDGYEIIYLDRGGNTLPEKPEPFKREDFANDPKDNSDSLNNNGWDDTGIPETHASEPQVLTENKQNQPFDRAIPAENEANALREQHEKARQVVEKYATMTDAEIEAILEKQLTQSLSDATPESIETDLQKRLNPKHITEAISLLNRYFR